MHSFPSHSDSMFQWRVASYPELYFGTEQVPVFDQEVFNAIVWDQ